jgi:YD repeat-containing protein
MRMEVVQYDDRSRPARVSYPTLTGEPAFEVEATYDEPSGRLKKLASTGASPVTYWELFETDDFDQPTREEQGTGAGHPVTRRTWYEETGRLRTLHASTTPEVSPGSILELAYAFDDSGNLATLSDAREGATIERREYGYDEFERLVAASHFDALVGGSEIGVAGWTYDDIGNILAREASGAGFETRELTYAYASNKPHAVTSVTEAGGGTQSYGYDVNGRLSSRTGPLVQELGAAGDPITYTRFHKPLRIPLPGSEAGAALFTCMRRTIVIARIGAT